MKIKEQFDREIKSFKETLKELKQRNDVKNTSAETTINKMIMQLGVLELELKRDVFLSFIEQKLNIKLSPKERLFILGRTGYEEILLDMPVRRSTLLECIRIACEGKDISNGSNIKERLIEIPIKFSFEYKGVLVPCGMLSETMDKLYDKNWRYYIK